MTTPYKSKGGPSRLFHALKYSAKGLAAAFKYEAAFRQELLVALFLFPLAFWIGESMLETLLLLVSILFILIVELLNSGLEAIADAVTIEHHPLIGRAKDLGSAAVLLSIVLALLIWVGAIIS